MLRSIILSDKTGILTGLGKGNLSDPIFAAQRVCVIYIYYTNMICNIEVHGNFVIDFNGCGNVSIAKLV